MAVFNARITRGYGGTKKIDRISAETCSLY